jgi:amino acid transporter
MTASGAHYWHDVSLNRVFVEFAIVLLLAALANIFSSHLLAILNNISVWWHVAGATAVVLILLLVPNHHSSLDTIATTKVNNTGFFSGHMGGAGFFLYVLPLAAILTQYTITGYDASAHLSEETHDAADGAAKGIWRSIFYSAIGGWILLLSFLFAVQSVDGVTGAGGAVDSIFAQALGKNWHVLVLAISAAGQLFCTTACMTSTTRMLFAFSRDGAVPGHKHWRKLNSKKVPVYSVILAAVVALILTSPALVKVDIAGAPVPIAFFAVVTIGVVGLYVAFAIPIWLRWKAGSNFQVGNWTLGPKYKWMCLVAVIEIAITSIIALLPTTLQGVPWEDGFAMKYVNYTILVVPGALIILWIWWHLSVKNWFTGPKHTIDMLPEQVASSE